MPSVNSEPRGQKTATYELGYDSAGRLADLGHDLAGTTYDQTLGFSYNPASQIKQNTRSNDSYAWNGHYNVTRAYTSNGLNQYTASGSATLTYDANGNLTSDGATSFVYDDENHLASASGGHSATLAYDPLGRLWQTVGSVTGTTEFEYDGDRILEEFNGSGASQRVYVYGDGGSPLVWYEFSGGTTRRYLLPDERGSTVAVADDSCNSVAINRYDEYGIPQSGNGGRFQYGGQALLIDLGLFYDKARIYSPTLGRFLQTDPIGYGDGMNWYGYVGADPVNHTDPSGLLADGCVEQPGSRIADCSARDSAKQVVNDHLSGLTKADKEQAIHDIALGITGAMDLGTVAIGLNFLAAVDGATNLKPGTISMVISDDGKIKF